MQKPKNPDSKRPTVKLIGQDGNAFAILGACRRAARKAGWSDERWNEFHARATGGDYHKVLGTVMEEFDVE